jgi:hypothetical protein
LKDINSTRDKKKQENAKKEESKMGFNNMAFDSFYSSYSDHNTLPRYKLPDVPSTIKVSERPKLR